MYRIFSHFSRSFPFHLKPKLLNQEGNHGHLRKVYKKISVFQSGLSKLHPKRDTRIHQTAKSFHIIPDAINIRHCREADIKTFLQLTRKEGWDNTEFDCRAVLKLDSSSFIVAADDADTPLGFIVVFDMFSDTCYSGQLIVKDAFRGRGVGRKLLTALWERIGEKNLCIYSTENLIESYRKQGILLESIRSIAYRGIITSGCKELKTNENECDIVPLTDHIWHDLLAYDSIVYKGKSREKILRLWFVGEYVYTVVAFSKGKVSGYGSFIKADDNQYIIRTVFGDNSKVVDEILDNMLARIPLGAMLTFVLLADKEVPSRFSGFEPTIVTQTMSTKFKIETESDKMFYICYHFV
ncbi:uncharacterized protein LOC123549928 [Mercenaria mercenaria]|uniref:uncharacterized protein LOC123549928 n=1 Tax=Mercenaria mercenaria TaxID=6596 RepID=UPI00234ED597|nr:uncharacterized protein LOC123549928 [Mercenaria mercenaria]